MKISRATLWILGGAALTAGAVVFGSWNWAVHNEAELHLGRAMKLESRDRALRAQVEEGTQRVRELKDSFRTASNRIVEAERLLDEERKTHDPLRSQIEKMLTEQIALKEGLNQRDKTIAKLELELKAAGEHAATSTASNVSSP